MTHPKILVGVDCSATHRSVVARAEALTRAQDGELILLRVCEFPSPPNWLEQYATIEADDRFTGIQQEWLDEEGEWLEGLYTEVRERGVHVSWELLEGNPAELLQSRADEVGARYLVIGGGARQGSRSLLGGVATRVVRKTRRRVLVVRNEESTQPTGYRRVLVATDFTGASERLVDAAIEVSSPDAAIDVLHCWSLPDAASSRALIHRSVDRLARDMRAEIALGVKKRGEALIERLDGSTRRLSFLVREDRARRGILTQLGEGRHDLVVVGSHGARGIWRFSLGSVAATVVRRSPASVLVVPVGDHRE